MEESKTDQLINQATEIILLPHHTDDDIKKLAKIRYFLSLEYLRINTQASAADSLYNNCRASKAMELHDDMAIGKASTIAKSEAEDRHGHYRELAAEAQGINKLLSAIEGFVITLQVEMKAQNRVSLNNQ